MKFSHTFTIIFTFFFPGLISCAEESYSFPTLFYSYNLIPGLRASLPHSEQLPFTIDESSYLIETAVEQCLSDAYIIINLPGLTHADLSDYQGFEYLRKHLSQASTIVSFPNIVTESPSTTLDLQKIEKRLRIHCNAKKHVIQKDDPLELAKYIDTRTRIIRMNLSSLTPDMTPEERLQKLQLHDLLLKEVIRKLPSPRFSVLFTTETVEEFDLASVDEDGIYKFEDIPDDPRNLPREVRSSVRQNPTMIFPDITVFDKTRYLDFERNKHSEKGGEDEIPDGMWAKDMEVNGGSEVDETWLSKKTKKIVKDKALYRFGEDDSTPVVIDKGTLLDNAVWILCVALVVGFIVFIDVLKVLMATVSGPFRKKKTRQEVKKND